MYMTDCPGNEVLMVLPVIRQSFRLGTSISKGFVAQVCLEFPSVSLVLL